MNQLPNHFGLLSDYLNANRICDLIELNFSTETFMVDINSMLPRLNKIRSRKSISNKLLQVRVTRHNSAKNLPKLSSLLEQQR